MPDWIIGVDVGGTFSDFSARNAVTGKTAIHKRPSTPEDPSRAIIEGLAELFEKSGIRGDDVARIAHGTTVATNALLQRKGAAVGLVTTKGFRDLVEIGRQVRPKIYDLQADAPPALAPRSYRFEISERIGPKGEVVTPLTDAAIAEFIEELSSHPEISGLAVCCLFSYLNPSHELRIAEAVRTARPDLFVSVSSDVQPEFREYERFSTTLINAFLQPEVARYLGRLRDTIAEIAPNAKFGIFQSSGGLMAVDHATAYPVRTALSGPAAGAVGAAASGKASGVGDILTLDMGGTSTDVCMIRGGETSITHLRDIAGFRIRLPMVDIHTVGAGGGSIAHIGPDGLLKVGPQSAGAVPGPACYGKGGTEPTVSDANVVLGRLPTELAGGGLMIDKAKAEAAVAQLAEQLGLGLLETALGIAGIVSSNMTRAIRAVSTERGHDPRNFTLMPFGGAGGLHAADVAKSLGISRILVPRAPGILCADGLIEADLQENFVATCRVPLSCDLCAVSKVADDLTRQAQDWLAQEASDAADPRVLVSFDMRYLGQNYELPVAADGKPGVDTLHERFFEAHRRSYGHVDRDAPVEIVNVRVKALARPERAAELSTTPSGEVKPEGIIEVYFSADAPVSATLYRRETLPVGTQITGPAIIAQFDATTVIPPGATATVDPALNLLVELGT